MKFDLKRGKQKKKKNINALFANLLELERRKSGSSAA